MSPARSATSAHRVPSHACPSPRAAGAPLSYWVRQARTVCTATTPPQGIAGLYTSFQPPGGLAPSVNRHHCAAVPSALPHDHRVRNASPGQTHLVVMAGNSPVTATGWKLPHLVAPGAAGNPGCKTPGRKPYFRYSSQGYRELQVIEGLHRAGVEFRSLSEDFDTSTATGRLQLSMVLAFSEWWRNSIRERSVAGQAKAWAEGRFPGRRPSLTERQREYIRAERSKGVSQRELAKPGGQPLDHPTGGQVGVGWTSQPLHGAWPAGSLTQLRSQGPAGERINAPATPPNYHELNPVKSSIISRF